MSHLFMALFLSSFLAVNLFAGDKVYYKCELKKITCSTCRDSNYQETYQLKKTVLVNSGLKKLDGSSAEDVYIGIEEHKDLSQYYKLGVYFTPIAAEPIKDAQAKWTFTVLRKQEVIEQEFLTEEDVFYQLKCERD